MKKIYLIILFVISVYTGRCQVFIPDSLYGINSISSFTTTPGETFTQFLMQSNGMIISAGYDYDISQNDFHVDMLRYDQCGIVDTTFGTGGISRVKFEQRNTGLGFTLQPDDKILSVGQQAPSNAGSQQIPYVARYLANGNPDTTFAGTGSNSLRFDPVSSGSFSSVHVMPDGRIVCMGNTTANINGGVNGAGVMRFMPDGSLDMSFNGSGKATYTSINPIFNKFSGFLLPDGHIISVGLYYDGSFLQHFFAVAFDSTGVVDTTWGTGGTFMHAANMWNIFAFAQQTDNKILMAAERDPQANGIIVIRLNTDGSQDMNFGTGGETSIVVTGMQLKNIKQLSTGKIVVMGGLNGSGYGIMLNQDGTVDSTFGSNGAMYFGLTNASGWSPLGDLLEISGNRLIGAGATQDFISQRYSLVSNVPHITYQHPNLTATGTGTFQWYLDSAIIPGATASTHDPVALGSYQVEITDDLGCTYMSDPFVILSVGINKNEIKGFTAYPNPFNNELIIENENNDLYIRLTDASGRIISNEFFLGKGRTSINTSDISSGLYFLNVRAEGVTRSVKVVK